LGFLSFFYVEMNASTGYTRKGKPSHKPGSGELRRLYHEKLRQQELIHAEQKKVEEQKEILYQRLKHAFEADEHMLTLEEQKKNVYKRLKHAWEADEKQQEMERLKQLERELEYSERAVSKDLSQLQYHIDYDEAARAVSRNGAFMGGVFCRKNRTRARSSRRNRTRK